MTPQVSVVIATYRRPELLHRCLAALVLQDFPAEKYEILVADDAASEETRQLVHGLANAVKPALHYLAVTGNHGPAAARNAGWRAARGEIIAFTDDDCLPDPGWLKAGVAECSEGVSAVSGRIRVPLPQPATDYERNEAGLERAEFVTANCFCRRAALVDVGGFDEQFTMAWREDSDLYFTLLEKGHRVVHEPAALVVHPVRPAPWGICLKQQRKSLFNALLYKKHPALYRRKIQPGPPWHYYGMAAAAFVALVSAVYGPRWLAWSDAALWLMLVFRFCGLRLSGVSHQPRHVLEMVITSPVVPVLSLFWRLWGAVRFRVLFL
jgi:glycosyltransferase involved in cell wall biosynthesis